MIALEPHPQGTVLSVRVHAGAGRNGIRGTQDGVLKVDVTQVPEKGKANKSLIEVLSRGLTLRKSQIELVAGQTARQKKFLVRDVRPEELSARIERVLKAHQERKAE